MKINEEKTDNSIMSIQNTKTLTRNSTLTTWLPKMHPWNWPINFVKS